MGFLGHNRQTACQVAPGHENGLRLRVYGDKGGLVHKNVGGGYDFTAELYTEENGDLRAYVFPVGGPGYWGPVQGYVAVDCRMILL